MRFRVEMEIVVDGDGTADEVMCVMRNLLLSNRTREALRLSLPSCTRDLNEIVVRAVRIADRQESP
jgi:hypothetical protein